ncbi:MAG: hypothetical protein ACR2M3_08330 [Thermomicrobiales bacterium]
MGWGRTLIATDEAWTHRPGSRLLALETFAANEHARAFHKGLGFMRETLALRSARGSRLERV